MKLTKKQEQDFRAYCEYEGFSFLTKEELAGILEILDIDISIANMLRNGMIESVYKGKVYRVAGKEGAVTELLNRMFMPDDEPFYLTGIYLYNIYGFIEQLPSRYQVANTKIQKEKSIAGFNFIFKKVDRGYFYGIDKETAMPKKERALIEFCYSYGYERFFELLRDKKDTIDIDMLADYAVSYPVNKVARWVLYGIDFIDKIEDDVLRQINTESLIALYERTSREGKIDKRFNIIINK